MCVYEDARQVNEDLGHGLVAVKMILSLSSPTRKADASLFLALNIGTYLEILGVRCGLTLFRCGWCALSYT